MRTEELIASLVQEVIERFTASEYPSRSVAMTGKDNFELLIRTPPRVPSFLSAKYQDIREQYAAAPSIEMIEIPEHLRDQGLFSAIVNALGRLRGIEAVCLSHVTNAKFAQYLHNSDNWQEIENDAHLPPGPIASLFTHHATIAPSFYRKFPED